MTVDKQMRVGKAAIIKGLRTLSIGRGSKLIVHCSLKSFGHVDGGAATVIDALMDVVTDGGTLMMPSFNHGVPYDEGGLFDVLATPTNSGAVANAFWQRPGVYRSMNPTHSFACWGKDAQRYTENHQRVDALGLGSPLELLYRDGGHALLLGVGYNRNTFHHVVETLTGAPCLTGRGERYPARSADGVVRETHTWGWRDGTCPINDPARYADRMAPYEQRATIGASQAICFALADCYTVVSTALREGLYGYPPCAQCPTRPRRCEWTV